jgi:hypothetical protein
MDYMEGTPLKVFASVSLNTIKVEQALLDSAAKLTQSSERACDVLEKSVAKFEQPITILILSVAFSIVVMSGAYLIGTIGHVSKNFKKKD